MLLPARPSHLLLPFNCRHQRRFHRFCLAYQGNKDRPSRPLNGPKRERQEPLAPNGPIPPSALSCLGTSTLTAAPYSDGHFRVFHQPSFLPVGPSQRELKPGPPLSPHLTHPVPSSSLLSSLSLSCCPSRLVILPIHSLLFRPRAPSGLADCFALSSHSFVVVFFLRFAPSSTRSPLFFW